MYPFKIVLIGDDEHLLPHVRRELLNQSAEVDAEFRNISSAIEQLKLHHDDTRLFVIHLNDLSHDDQLKQLSGTFAGRPILVLMNGGADSSSILNVMRHGGSQVVMLPLSIAEFTEALNSILVQFGHLANRTRVIAVTGGHGGAGSTSVAINLAYEVAQQYQLDTILLELQLNVGVLGAFLQIEPQHTTEELLAMGHAVDLYAIKNALVPFGDRLSLLSGPLHPKAPGHVETALVTNLIRNAGHLAGVVILDVPSTMDDLQMEILGSADNVLLVAEQTIPSLQMTLELMRLGLQSHSPTVVINRFDSSLEGFDVHHLKQVLGVDDLRTIVDDSPGFHAAVNQGQPLRLASPKSPAIADIDTLAENVLDIRNHGRPGKYHQGIFSQLTHLLGV